MKMRTELLGPSERPAMTQQCWAIKHQTKQLHGKAMRSSMSWPLGWTAHVGFEDGGDGAALSVHWPRMLGGCREVVFYT